MCSGKKVLYLAFYVTYEIRDTIPDPIRFVILLQRL